MKPILFALTTVTASPAIAHVSTHAHLHANDASWLPVLLGVLAIAAATSIAIVRRR